MSKACLGCANFIDCTDRKRGTSNYSCKSWRAFSIVPAHASNQDAEMMAKALLKEGASAIDGLDKEDDDPYWKKKEFSLVSVLDDILNTDSPIPRNLVVDDRDIPEMKNFYDWCFNPRGGSVTPFARQMWIAMMLFAECCPRCSDKKWLQNIHNVPVDYPAADFPERVTFLEYGVCPHCGARKSELVLSGELNFFSELALCLGQRSGKSALAAMMAPYHHHKLLKLQRPAQYYNLLKSQTLTCTYTALSFKKACTLLWLPIKSGISDSPWYQEYHKFLKTRGDELGEELLLTGDTFSHYRYARFYIGPAAPNGGTLRGDSRALGCVDEIGWFRFGEDSEEMTTVGAEAIYAPLANSLTTVRTAAIMRLKQGYDKTMHGYMINLSSPSSQLDKIMTLVRNSEGSRDILGAHLPTWEFNPTVPRSALNVYFSANRSKAERDFGANPPIASSPLIDSMEAITGAFSSKRANAVMLSPSYGTSQSGVKRKAAKIVKTAFPQGCNKMILALDAGYSNNSFALALGYRSSKAIKIENEGNARLVFPALLEIQPEEDATLSYNQIFKHVIVPLIKTGNIGAIVADRWNSLMLLHTVEEEYKVHAEQYSLKYKELEQFSSYLQGNGVEVPCAEVNLEEVQKLVIQGYPSVFEGKPVAHFALQCVTVRDTGRTVEKGDGLTDDVFRAAALASRFLLDAAWCKKHLKGGVRGSGGALVAANGGGSSGMGGGSPSGRAVVAIPGQSTR